MATKMLSVAAAAVTVFGACLSSAAADADAPPAGTVVGSNTIGLMNNTFTVPYSEFDDTVPSGCGTVFAGCTGDLFESADFIPPDCDVCVLHEVNGTITVIDDCTFRIQGWQFDGVGPAVEWWGAKQAGVEYIFPYPETALKIGELGEPGSYQVGSLHGGDSDVIVRLGLDAEDNQIELSDEINHISLWCEDFAFDLGNAPLTCGVNASGAAADADGAPASTDDEPTEADATDATATTEPSAALPVHSVVGAAAALGALGLALL